MYGGTVLYSTYKSIEIEIEIEIELNLKWTGILIKERQKKINKIFTVVEKKEKTRNISLDFFSKRNKWIYYIKRHEKLRVFYMYKTIPYTDNIHKYKTNFFYSSKLFEEDMSRKEKKQKKKKKRKEKRYKRH